MPYLQKRLTSHNCCKKELSYSVQSTYNIAITAQLLGVLTYHYCYGILDLGGLLRHYSLETHFIGGEKAEIKEAELLEKYCPAAHQGLGNLIERIVGLYSVLGPCCVWDTELPQVADRWKLQRGM